jgi:hypothetical protein
MKQFEQPAAQSGGPGMLSPTAPVTLPAPPPGNVPLSLQQLFGTARRPGNSGPMPGGPPGNPFNPFF